MQTFHTLEGIGEINTGLHLALGVFDGVHIGHQAVIKSVVEAAEREGGIAGVLTFDPHPIRLLAPHVAPQRILASLNHKKELLDQLGVKVLVVIPFTEAFSKIEALEFLNALSRVCVDLRTLAMGKDWKFGHQRGGDLSLLENFGKQCDVQVRAADAVILDGERVSSTRIRQAIRDGNMPAVTAMLGREYSVLGTVIEGRKLGRELGFPTANLRVYNEQLPMDGVWAVDVTLANGAVYRGAGNLGLKPTLENEGERRILEIHLLDFEGDLYGSDIVVHFAKHLRDEKKFDSLEELKKQIKKDVELCRRVKSPRIS